MGKGERLQEQWLQRQQLLQELISLKAGLNETLLGQTKRSSEGNWRQIQETCDKRIKTRAQSKNKKNQDDL